MKPSIRRFGVAARTIIAVAALMGPALIRPVDAQPFESGPDRMPHMMDQMRHHQQMIEMHGNHAAPTGTASPTMPGEGAFGAIQEIVGMLEADPQTDWSKVDLESLRQHLIDMNAVTLNAAVTANPVEGGLAFAVTGTGRTSKAIQRMVPAHARAIDGHEGWKVRSEILPTGALLTVTAGDPKQIERIRGLGFIGVLASGSHHQLHHLALAKGDVPHVH
jgi:hypothetical protein